MTDGHFVYKSERHGSDYLSKWRLFLEPFYTSVVCREIAKRFAGDNIEVVIGPEMGGGIISQWVAFHLHDITLYSVLSLCAEEAGDKFIVKPEQAPYIVGRKVLVVDDTATSGATVRKVVSAVRALGGDVAAVALFLNRRGLTEKDVGDVPKLSALLDIKLEDWSEEECFASHLCKAGVPVNTEVGRGAEFAARQKQKQGS